MRRALACALVSVLTLAACADDGPGAEAPTAAVPEPTPAPTASPTSDALAETPTVEPTGVVVTVTALDNTFRPEHVEARVGDEVVWENRGRNDHDVLSITGTLADGTAWGVDQADFAPGMVYSHVFTEPGEYRYYCTIHGTSEIGMIGTVTVTG